MAEVRLLGTWRSPFSTRVIWALNLKGVKYEYVEEDLFNKSDDLLKYNPVHKKIPVLIHGGKPVAESTVILEYIEETWPEKPLLSQDPVERAAARFWINFGEEKNPTFFRYFRTTGEELEKATEESKQVLKTVETYGLGEKKFFGGDEIGMTDICFGWIAWGLGAMEEAVGVKLLEPGELPLMHKWIHNFRDHPIIKDDLPQHDALLHYFKRLRHQFIA